LALSKALLFSQLLVLEFNATLLRSELKHILPYALSHCHQIHSVTLWFFFLDYWWILAGLLTFKYSWCIHTFLHNLWWNRSKCCHDEDLFIQCKSVVYRSSRSEDFHAQQVCWKQYLFNLHRRNYTTYLLQNMLSQKHSTKDPLFVFFCCSL